MPARVRPAVVLAALSAALVAVPACKKGGDGPGLGLRSGGRERVISQNNLKQIALALHMVAETNRGPMPVGIVGPDGKTAGLSWRVAILPYVEQVTLYRQFKLDEPWDSEHNKKLIAKMPQVYAAPETDPAQGLTYYQGFAGKGALFHPADPDRTGAPGSLLGGLPISAIPDGTSNTAMVVEAAEPVVWTKPADLEYRPDGPLPKVGGVFRDGLNVALADGFVTFLRRDELTDEKLKALIVVNDGARVNLP
jgi:hypothetical protein